MLNIFKGDNIFHFHFSSLGKEGQVLKKRICSRKSKFFVLRIDTNMEELRHPRKKTCSQKLCKTSSGSVAM